MFDIIYSIAINFFKIKKTTSMEGQESLQVTWNIANYWLLLEVQRAVYQLYSGREQVQRYVTTM
jgi:hypothetical protein